MMISPRYSRKSPVLLNATQNMSPNTMVPSLLLTNFGLSWNISRGVPVSIF